MKKTSNRIMRKLVRRIVVEHLCELKRWPQALSPEQLASDMTRGELSAEEHLDRVVEACCEDPAWHEVPPEIEVELSRLRDAVAVLETVAGVMDLTGEHSDVAMLARDNRRLREELRALRTTDPHPASLAPNDPKKT
jgi:hypothetical protein